MAKMTKTKMAKMTKTHRKKKAPGCGITNYADGNGMANHAILAHQDIMWLIVILAQHQSKEFTTINVHLFKEFTITTVIILAPHQDNIPHSAVEKLNLIEP